MPSPKNTNLVVQTKQKNNKNKLSGLDLKQPRIHLPKIDSISDETHPTFLEDLNTLDLEVILAGIQLQRKRDLINHINKANENSVLVIIYILYFI